MMVASGFPGRPIHEFLPFFATEMNFRSPARQQYSPFYL
jgi:hypothetical protein